VGRNGAPRSEKGNPKGVISPLFQTNDLGEMTILRDLACHSGSFGQSPRIASKAN
jgi:hypothetical protein